MNDIIDRIERGCKYIIFPNNLTEKEKATLIMLCMKYEVNYG